MFDIDYNVLICYMGIKIYLLCTYFFLVFCTQTILGLSIVSLEVTDASQQAISGVLKKHAHFIYIQDTNLRDTI